MYLQRWHGWCHMKPLPSRRVVCTPYNRAPCHFMQSHIRKVHACLSVTCHLHFWQNDRGLLRATAVTRRWNGYRNKSQHKKLTPEKNILPPLMQGSNPRPFDHEPGALTTELSPLPVSLIGVRITWLELLQVSTALNCNYDEINTIISLTVLGQNDMFTIMSTYL